MLVEKLLFLFLNYYSIDMLKGLLILMFVRPLAPPQFARALAGCAAATLILACGLSMAARYAEPMQVSAANTSTT